MAEGETVAQPIQLFQNYTLQHTVSDQGRPITFTQNWIGILLQVAEVGQGGSARFFLEWSNEGNVWFEPEGQPDTVATVTATGTYIKSMPIRACFWRLRAIVPPGQPAGIICSATALV